MTEQLLTEDIARISGAIPEVEKLHGASVLVTGASGLIGSLTARALLDADRRHGLGLTVYALARDRQRLQKAVGAESGALRHVLCDLDRDALPCPPADYVFHCASPTASAYFCSRPVETFSSIVHGTEKILRQAAESGQTKKIVFLSSIEVYGAVVEKRRIPESYQGYVDPLQVRSSYPMAKRMAECLCKSYCSEYGVPAVIARLTQTFGPGISPSDRRVFVQFAESALNGSDLVLHTPGQSAKPYVYTVDAVTALFYLLFRGENGCAYNVANEDTLCTIREMAELVSGLGEKPVRVVFSPKADAVYPPDTYLNPDCSRLRALGWEPHTGLAEMYRRLMGHLSANFERYDESERILAQDLH